MKDLLFTKISVEYPTISSVKKTVRVLDIQGTKNEIIVRGESNDAKQTPLTVKLVK